MLPKDGKGGDWFRVKIVAGDGSQGKTVNFSGQFSDPPPPPLSEVSFASAVYGTPLTNPGF